jgi:hypothetical protein
MRLWNYAKNFKSTSEVSASFHQNISRGYYEIDKKGDCGWRGGKAHTD